MKKKILWISAALAVLAFFSCSESGPEGGLADKDGSRGDGTGITAEYLGSGGSGESGGVNGDTTIQVEPGQITAGEWNDLVNWDFWVNLGQNEDLNKAIENWKWDPQERYAFVVNDRLGKPIADCLLEMKSSQGEILWKARTDNRGRAELWLNLFEQSQQNPMVTITYGSQTLTIVNPLPFDNGGAQTVSFETVDIMPNEVDIAFVVDATGSMGDEITYLKAELINVTGRVEENSQASLRLASVFYRDEGDEYLTRVAPFTDKISDIDAFIRLQQADGGGDYEEAVHTALIAAVTQLSWKQSARARLLFLLLDAPPHLTPSIVNDLHDVIEQASAKGIRIIPISASGVNKDTEFLFRFFAISTGGTYVFITNHSGIGGDHLEATVGDYEVELLNDLIVRLIGEYSE